MPAFPVARARAHLEAVAESTGITVFWIRGFLSATSYQPAKIVCIPRPTNAVRYLVALHEFGHVLCENSGAWWSRWEGDDSNLFVEVAYEGLAWAWAAANRDRGVPVTDADWRRAGTLFASYMKGSDLRAVPQDPGDTETVHSGAG